MRLTKIDKHLRDIHVALWASLDELAARKGLSASGLARFAGLDLTTFNPSKRHHFRSDRPRFPTFETLDRVLCATKTTWPEFIEMIMSKMPESTATTH